MNQKNANQKITSQKNVNQKNVKQKITKQKTANQEFQNAHGAVPYGMTNDYMFRAVLQYNNKALRGLICSLLHLREEEVLSVEITNPIILGESIKSKEFRLDINVILNDCQHINLEMQVARERIWADRSLSYLCRSFDKLNHGQEYHEVKPVIHIGFLDYTLFKGCPEFYATYKLLNVKNHNIYSDNLTLSVVDLSKIELATDVDKEYHIDYWAKLFKANTWEEIKMLASKDQYIDEASQTIFYMTTDEQVRNMCRDREDYYAEIKTYERDIAEAKAELADKDAELADKDVELADKDAIIQSLLTEIESLKASANK